jgi:hypothetical protein
LRQRGFGELLKKRGSSASDRATAWQRSAPVASWRYALAARYFSVPERILRTPDRLRPTRPPTKPAANATTGHEVGGAGAAGLSPFSLKDDVALRNDKLAARNRRGVSISLGTELWRCAAPTCARCLPISMPWPSSALPGSTVSASTPDPGRSFDQFAELAQLAAERSIATVTGRRRKPGDAHRHYPSLNTSPHARPRIAPTNRAPHLDAVVPRWGDGARV